MALDTARTIANLRSLTQTFDLAVQSASPVYPAMCNVVNSDGADEEYGAIGSVPGMREWLGDRVFHTLKGAKFTLANRKWESSVRVEKDDIDDARLAKYGPVLQNMGVEASYHPDELMFEVLIAGESQACFDGQYFFDTDHLWGESGTQSNDLTYAAATGTTPTETEFRAAYHQARAAMLGFKRDNGKPWHRPVLGPITDFMLLVPPAIEETARGALTKTLINNGENNLVIDTPRIVPCTYLTDATKFYLLRTGQAMKPFVFQNRQPLRREMKGMDDIEFKDVKFMTDARYSVGYFAWWNAVLTTFT